MSESKGHIWDDVISAETKKIYETFQRESFFKNAPALLLIDLWNIAYEGGSLPVIDIVEKYPMACGEYAWNAIEPTQKLLAAAREKSIPIIYSTAETDPNSKSVLATKRKPTKISPDAFEIKAEFKPQSGELIIKKQRASAFFGTHLISHLNALGVDSVIIAGESTSGCVRATALDAFNYGFHTIVVEECCFDRSLLSHKVNLFDLHSKYADVRHVEDVIAYLASLPK